MRWSFSIGWFFGGLGIIIAGILMIKFHRQIADNLASGVQSYGKVKLGGIIAIALGFIFMMNLHSSLLYLIFHIIMPEQFP